MGAKIGILREIWRRKIRGEYSRNVFREE